MPEREESDSSVEAAVERLFESQSPGRHHSLLIVGNRDAGLLQAVIRYTLTEDETDLHNPPAITVVTQSDSISEIELPSELDIEVVTDDFLREGVPIDSAFDYILADPPQLRWECLETERRREYATQFASLTTADETTSGEALFIEQSLRHLATGGIAVVLTDAELWDDAGPVRLHSEVHDKLQRIESIASVDADRVLAIFRGGLLSATPAPPPKPNAEAVETNLAVSLDSAETGLTANSIATSPVVRYPGTIDATSGYTQMLLDDYDAVLVGDSDTPEQGYISRSRFQPGTNQSLSDAAIEVDDRVTLAPQTPLGKVIDILGQERFRFIRARPESTIDGIVTRFDLNRIPVYLFLFDRFSEFEVGLRRFLREFAPDWNERSSVVVPWRGTRTVVPDRLACAQLGEIIRIIDDLGLRDEIPVRLPTDDGLDLRNLKNLRNAVAHYSPLIHTMGEARLDGERDAPTLAAEYALLSDCIEEL